MERPCRTFQIGRQIQTVHTIAPSAPVFDAVKQMADKGIGSLVVVEGERVVGIITERDYARKIVLVARSSKDTPVRDIMTLEVMYVHPGQTSGECMALMTENRVRHLPSWRRQARRHRFDRGSRQGHHLRAEIPHRTARALHHRRSGLSGNSALARGRGR